MRGDAMRGEGKAPRSRVRAQLRAWRIVRGATRLDAARMCCERRREHAQNLTGTQVLSEVRVYGHPDNLARVVGAAGIVGRRIAR